MWNFIYVAFKNSITKFTKRLKHKLIRGVKVRGLKVTLKIRH